MEAQNIDDFIETILKDKGITDLEPEIRDQLKSEMKTTLMNQINQAAIAKLSEEKAAELATLIDDPEFTAEKMSDFMQNSGVNLSEVAFDTMLKFREFYLSAKD